MYSAAETRMRPMLMTALSACIGLFFAAFATGTVAARSSARLAMVVVGGMLLGPVVLLVVMPASCAMLRSST